MGNLYFSHVSSENKTVMHIIINQHIPSIFRIKKLNNTAASSNQNSNSASTIAWHLLNNTACTVANRPTMFSILETVNNEFIYTRGPPHYKIPTYTVHPKTVLYTALFNNPNLLLEKNCINHADSSGLWQMLIFSPDVHYPESNTSNRYLSVTVFILWRDVTEMNGHLF